MRVIDTDTLVPWRRASRTMRSFPSRGTRPTCDGRWNVKGGRLVGNERPPSAPRCGRFASLPARRVLPAPRVTTAPWGRPRGRHRPWRANVMAGGCRCASASFIPFNSSAGRRSTSATEHPDTMTTIMNERGGGGTMIKLMGSSAAAADFADLSSMNLPCRTPKSSVRCARLVQEGVLRRGAARRSQLQHRVAQLRSGHDGCRDGPRRVARLD